MIHDVIKGFVSLFLRIQIRVLRIAKLHPMCLVWVNQHNFNHVSVNVTGVPRKMFLTVEREISEILSSYFR